MTRHPEVRRDGGIDVADIATGIQNNVATPKGSEIIKEIGEIDPPGGGGHFTDRNGGLKEGAATGECAPTIEPVGGHLTHRIGDCIPILVMSQLGDVPADGNSDIPSRVAILNRIGGSA